MILPVGSHLASGPQPGGPRPLPAAVPGSTGPAPQDAPTPLRASPDHLALVAALLRAGEFLRAEALLGAVWDPGRVEEQPQYFRLWLLAGQGRVAEALDAGRTATARFPGSAAMAYLHAVLEVAKGDAAAALEAALRAAAIMPDRVEPERLVHALLAEAGHGQKRPGDEHPGLRSPPRPSAEEFRIPDPLDAALLGAALLSPPGSGRPYRPVLPPPPDAISPAEPFLADGRWRLIWIGAATVGAAFWASREPLLASAALAAAVAWFSRPRPGRSGPE